MKKILGKLIFATALLAFLFAGCQKQEVRAIYTPGSSPTLNSSASTLVLDSTQDSVTAVTFTWPKVNYGYQADVSYTLEFDAPSDSFKNATQVTVGLNTLSKSYITKDFNVLAFQTLGLAPNTASPVAVRVMANVNQNGLSTGPSSIAPVYSNTINLTVTPYKILIVYPMLWVPGDYEGWSPASAPTVASVEANNQYEGYIYFPPGGTYQFKFTPAPNWNTSYGWLSSVTTGNSVTGTMSTSGGNLFVPTSGYYLLRADLNPTPATWSATQITTWGLIGDATPGGWSTDTPMTFDPASGTWSVTVNLVSTGTFKFRANDSWALNLGYNTTTFTMAYNGPNIAVPATGSGNYTVILNLSSAGNYTFSMKKN
ncbi:MAG: SusE domain-containing protein [Chitinophagaceae bacterium]